MKEGHNLERFMIVLMRVSIGWTFLYAGIRQVPNPEWSAAGFLGGATTFPGFFDLMASPLFLPIINAVIPWAHLLIGLALISGTFFRLAALGGAILMVLYYLPRLDFPMVGPNNYLVEYHLVYAFLLVYMMAMEAGRVFGVDGWLAERPKVRDYLQKHPALKLTMG